MFCTHLTHKIPYFTRVVGIIPYKGRLRKKNKHSLKRTQRSESSIQKNQEPIASQKTVEVTIDDPLPLVHETWTKEKYSDPDDSQNERVAPPRVVRIVERPQLLRQSCGSSLAHQSMVAERDARETQLGDLPWSMY